MGFKVSAKNFLCYKDLDLDLENRGLVLFESENRDEALFSSNGGGKSSAIEALNWGIFGRSTKTSDQDKLVHLYDKGGKDCEVHVYFANYHIARYRKHNKFKNDVHLFKILDNGEEHPLTEKSTKETQLLIEQSLGLSYESFRHAIYFSQSNLTRFSTATDAEQKAIIEDILSLNALSKAQTWCKENSNSIERQIDSEKSKTEKFTYAIASAQTRLTDFTRRHAEFETKKSMDLAVENSTLSRLQKELGALILSKQESTSSTFDKAKAEELISKTHVNQQRKQLSIQNISNIDVSIRELRNSLAQNNSVLRNMEDSIHKLNKKISDLNIDNVNTQNKKTHIENAIEALEEAYEHYEGLHVACIECGQGVSDETAKEKQASITSQIANHKKEIVVCGEKIDKNLLELEVINKNIFNVKESIKNAKEKSTYIEKEIENKEEAKVVENKSIEEHSRILEYAANLRLKIQEEESKLKLVEQKINTWMSMIEQKQKQIETLASSSSPYIISIENEQESIKSTQAQLDEINKKTNELSTEKKYYDYWVDGFSNAKLKSYIMESITPQLNERANFFSSFLTSGSYSIEISTQTKLKSGEMRDKFSVNVKSPSGADYEMCSGGEKKRLDLCILLALQELTATRANFPLSLLVLDEFSESLDGVGSETMIHLLKEIAKDKDTILYITHNPEMKHLFQNTIRIVKENNVSRMLNGTI